MKTRIHTLPAALLGLAFALASCGDRLEASGASAPADGRMTFDVRYPATSSPTRVTGDHFDSSDPIGLYVTQNGTPLEVAGNYVNNTLLTWDGATWTPSQPVYWDGGTYDIFAYYPYTTPVNSVDNFPFTVADDQTLSGAFESSDFLFASALSQSASDTPVALEFRHVMSRLQVRLIRGEDFEGDFPDEAEVYIHGTVPTATIDLSVGIATKYNYGTTHTLRAKPLGSHEYAAIVVPQRLNSRQPFIEVVMKGVSYLVESSFLFKPGIQHTVSITIEKNPEQVKIDIGGEIEDWEEA